MFNTSLGVVGTHTCSNTNMDAATLIIQLQRCKTRNANGLKFHHPLCFAVNFTNVAIVYSVINISIFSIGVGSCQKKRHGKDYFQ